MNITVLLMWLVMGVIFGFFLAVVSMGILLKRNGYSIETDMQYLGKITVVDSRRGRR